MIMGPTISAPSDTTESSLACDSMPTALGLEPWDGVLVDMLGIWLFPTNRKREERRRERKNTEQIGYNLGVFFFKKVFNLMLVVCEGFLPNCSPGRSGKGKASDWFACSVGISMGVLSCTFIIGVVPEWLMGMTRMFLQRN